MKELALCVSFAFAAACLPAQHLGFQVASILGSSGQPCDPFACTAAQVSANAGSNILMRTKGASWQPHFLLASSQTLPCVTIPGFQNALLLGGPATATLLSLEWSMIYVMGPPPVCGGRIGSTLIPLPAGLPMGASVRLQLLAPALTVSGEVWTFSNAVDLTIQ